MADQFYGKEVATKAEVNAKSTVSVSLEGTATDVIHYITVDGIQHKIVGGVDAYTKTETDNLLLPKQNSADSTLATTAKTVVGGINELNSTISALAGVVKVKVVSSVPESPENNTIYYIGTSAPYAVNLYTTDAGWTGLGTTDIDLTDYQKKAFENTSFTAQTIEGVLAEISETFLKLTGGTLTGSLTVKTGDASIVADSNSSYVRICGGQGFSSGANLILKGNDTADGGFFKLSAGSKTLQGQPNGDLYWSGAKVFSANDIDYITQQVINAIYPVGSYAFGPMPSFGTWQQITGDMALWIKSSASEGTEIQQSLPKPSIKSTFAGSGATTGSNGAHTHTFTGSLCDTNTKGEHTHSRGTMEITGKIGSICAQGGYGEGAFSWNRDSSAELKGDNQSRGSFTFTASKNWSGVTSGAGSHYHSVTPVGTNAINGAHTHSFTAKGSVTSSVNTSGAYGDGTKVQPDAYVLTVWRRTA